MLGCKLPSLIIASDIFLLHLQYVLWLITLNPFPNGSMIAFYKAG